MRLLVLKLGLPIGKEGNVGSGEAYNLMLLLSKEFIIDYYTDPIYQEAPFANMKNILDNVDTTKYDGIVVMNGLPNIEKDLDKRNYEIMKKFDKIIYLYLDPYLPLVSYKNTEYDISNKEIIVIHQPYKIDPYMRFYSDFKNVRYYAFFDFLKYNLAVSDRLDKEYSLEKKRVDLSYGGGFRENRVPLIVNWYFNYPDDITVEIFGSIADSEKLKKFANPNEYKYPILGQKVPHNKFLLKQTEAYATFSIGEPEYFGNNLTQRVYEAVLANVASFVYKHYDPFKLYFKSDELRKFLYVETKEELYNKIKYIKNNKSFYEELLDKQYDDIKVNPGQIASKLCYVIKEFIK